MVACILLIGQADALDSNLHKTKTDDLKSSALQNLRSEADSNRCTRFCRPLPSHSAIRPFYPFYPFGCANIVRFYFKTKKNCIFTVKMLNFFIFDIRKW